MQSLLPHWYTENVPDLNFYFLFVLNIVFAFILSISRVFGLWGTFEYFFHPYCLSIVLDNLTIFLVRMNFRYSLSLFGDFLVHFLSRFLSIFSRFCLHIFPREHDHFTFTLIEFTNSFIHKHIMNVVLVCPLLIFWQLRFYCSCSALFYF